MSRTAVLSLVIGLLAGADAPAPPAPGAAAAALQGEWRMASLVVHGDPVPEDQVRSGRLSVAGDRYTPTFGTAAVAARIALDPSRAPGAVDFTYLDGPQKGKTVKGIYAVRGDTLTVCRGLGEGDPRPARFEAPAGSGHLLVVWKRAPRASGEAARELARLQGSWTMVSAVTDGKPVPEQSARKVTVHILGTTHAVRVGGQVVAHGVGFEVDPTASPKAVTDTVLDGPGKGTVIRGIYRLDGDTLTSCVAAPDHDRPTSFDAGPGTGRSLRVFRRDPAARDPSTADGLEHLKFEGTWAFNSPTADGRPVAHDELRDARLTLRGDRFVSVNARGTFHGTFKADAEATPRTIDLTYTDGPEAGHTLRGVYALDGDTYRVCLSPAGQPRPRRLDDTGGGNVVSVFKRLSN
jgi:uncharacterized protein (TIGR03067 family)